MEGFDEVELLRPYVAAVAVLAGDVADSVREDIALDVVRDGLEQKHQSCVYPR